MTTVPSSLDFYVLESQDRTTRYIFICRLVEKIYRLNHRIYIRTETASDNRVLDDLLWTFRAGSFVPHAIDTGSNPEPVLIGNAESRPQMPEILFNLQSNPVQSLDAYKRVIEIIDASSDLRQLGRTKYKFYRDAGLNIETHRIAA